MRHDPGLAASPPVRYKIENGKGLDLLAFAFCCPLWTDSLLAERRTAVYGGTPGQRTFPGPRAVLRGHLIPVDCGLF